MKIHENYQLCNSIEDGLGLHAWLDFIDRSLQQMKQMLKPDGVVVLVVGDVARNIGGVISLAREVMQRVMHNRTFSYIGCMSDDLCVRSKTTRIWRETKKWATNTDRLIVLSNGRPNMRLARLQALFEDSNRPFDWTTDDMSIDRLKSNAKEFAGVRT